MNDPMITTSHGIDPVVAVSVWGDYCALKKELKDINKVLGNPINLKIKITSGHENAGIFPNSAGFHHTSNKVNVGLIQALAKYAEDIMLEKRQVLIDAGFDVNKKERESDIEEGK